MRTKIFTQIFAIALFLIASVMNCYAQDTRYLVVENNEGIEKAAFYLSEIPVPVNGVLTLKSTENKPYEYKTSEHRFRFDTRPYGQATSVEQIAIEKWTVSYTNGMLHIDNPVGDVYIYSIIGTLIKVAPRVTDISVYLQAGNIYIIKSGQHTVKLRANNNGVTASAEPKTKATFINSQPFMLRSGLSTYSDDVAPFYWNIATGSGTVPFDINTIGFFVFNNDENAEVYFLGEDIPVVINYLGSSFATEPLQTDFSWNLSNTIKFGGAAYGSFLLDRTVEYVSVVHKKGVIIWDCQKEQETKIPMEKIAANIWTDFPNGKISVFTLSSEVIMGMSYIVIEDGVSAVFINQFGNGELAAATLCSNFSHNNNTNVIPATIRVNANGSLTVSYTNHLGIAKEKNFIW